MARSLNIVVVWLFVLLGTLLSFVVPRVDRTYSSLYTDWDSNPLLAVRAFHWPFYVWFLAFLAPALGTHLLRKIVAGRALAIWSVGAFLLFLATTVISLDWLTGFIFCHPWGCTHWLG